MASIEKRTTTDGEVSFRVKVRLKGYPVQTATFQRLTDARKWAQDTESAIRNGRHFKTATAKRHTLGELIDRYQRDVLPRKKTGHDQVIQLNWWKNRLGAYLLADITPALLSEYRDRLSNEPMAPRTKKAVPAAAPRHRTPATVVRYMAALSHVFNVAVKEWVWLEDSPLRKVSKPKEPKGRVRFLTDDERARLLAACRESSSPFLYPVVVLALSTGMRHGELMNMRWGDVDLSRGRAVLHETKNGERRAVHLTGHALEQLRELAKVRRLDTDLLFPSSVKRGHLLKPQAVKPIDLRAPWEAALEKAEITNFKFHDLRHSCASYLAMNGATLAEIAEVLGHKTLSMVKRYAHLSDAHVSSVVEKMNSKIFGS